MVKKEKTQIRNIKNEKVKYCTDVTVLKRWSPSAVYLKLSQNCELAVLQYKIKSSIKMNKKENKKIINKVMLLTHPKLGCGKVEKFDFLARVQ